MATTWAASTTLTATTDAVNTASFAATDAIGAKLAPSNAVAVSTVMRQAPLASLGATPASGSRATQMYALMQTMVGAQNDATELLAFLAVFVAASGCKTKSQTEELLERIFDQTKEMLEEIFGYRKMGVSRPDSDQVAEILRAVVAARAAGGLDALRTLH